ncbi:hypothetical protein HCH_04340 [Hahella chejuensis KCTC 2396]|uniref:Uncharacterized protein n=1 Tax=Hahella chejuensis (strain KCTC 2396) TaxID=349521 RepID=Q2SE78_HAHCH|nr:hypothetical protein [Hahella chejuensis]ABC31046.1 hypothetical protein HCH_04340 [Hahella chejuensis KCTC 2396]
MQTETYSGDIVIASRRKKSSTLEREFPGYAIIDVTSKASAPWVKFSPFYPHSGIPIPFSSETAQSVEGIWQGLKVFEGQDIDPSRFDITDMKGIKRTVRRYGRVLGHRKGPGGELIPYIEARKQIYLPAYHWTLTHRLQAELSQLSELLARHEGLVLLDYETNTDINDPRKPLSHAALIRRFLQP